ncbi:hypothetical protein DACRYDRAFT_85458 [Dacryopinax primogenitus]|uniref:Nucleotide-diphospho-sugar transferase n=1 Tax=Dacryopinax primogenitus (strain DJM 731) TaxID=1858805 RepID=M5FZU1_DACPD|nr:uncharacterized protein DACRYDRAFT_85458 [Dacryopinax primogenitus]EJT97027.1 hypothetical protein DACRYDRAFT_85458 [Dacryopinax primogenitus]
MSLPLPRGRYRLLLAVPLLLLALYIFSPSSTSFRPFGISSPYWLPQGLEGHEDLIGPVDIEDDTDLSSGIPVADAPTSPQGWEQERPTVPIEISHPGLRVRLHALLTRPVLPADAALAHNARSCPLAVHDKLVNPDQLKGQREFWAGVSEDDVRSRREGIVRWLEGLEKGGVDVVAPELGYGEQRRGIVITAGNKDTLQRAITSIKLLRGYYMSPLPIELFSFPGELPTQGLAELQALRVTHRVLTNQQKVPGAWKNFHIKALAVLLSEFDEVLYLDSDVLCLREPSYLFEDETFKKTGAAFWTDINKDHPENAIWRLLGRTCDPTEWEVDSGAFLISKSGNGGLNLAALHIAAHMQAEHEFWFRLSGGDKDTFRYAFWALGLEYVSAPRWMSILGYEDNGKFCGLSMVHYDLSHPPNTLPSTPPSPLFVHANLVKHSPPLSPAQKAFQTLKRPSPDYPASAPILDRAHYFVYSSRGGMCLDLELLPAPSPVEAAQDWEEEDEYGPPLEGKGLEIVTEQWARVEDGVYAEFPGVWVDEGGKVGGW